jgi:hypothetical protein
MKLRRANSLKTAVIEANIEAGILDKGHENLVNLYPEDVEGRPTRIKSVTSYRGVEIRWNSQIQVFEKVRGRDPPIPLHPNFDFKSVSNYTNSYFSDVNDWNKIRRRSKIFMQHGMSYCPASTSGIDPFTVYLIPPFKR